MRERERERERVINVICLMVTVHNRKPKQLHLKHTDLYFCSYN